MSPQLHVDEGELRTEDERNTTRIFRATAPSTVFVTQLRVIVDQFERIAAEVPAGSGSGFAWDDRGTIALGDVVVGIGGSPVGSYDDFYDALDEHHAGDKLDVEILRAGQVATARVTLSAVGTAPQGAD